MLCLSDNDYILKLAEYDLLKETLAALKVKRSEVLILHSARRVFQKNKSIQRNHTITAIQRALKFTEDLATIERTNVEEFALLNKVQNIEDGEANIFAATKDMTDFRVATGDKRSLIALSAAPSCAAIAARLSGRVICLEQTIRLLIREHGYTYVQEKVGMCVGDESIDHAFAGGKKSHPEADCLKWLDSFINDLRNVTGGLLEA